MLKYCKIRGKGETECYTVRTSSIRKRVLTNNEYVYEKFVPNHANDFSENKWYLVKWKCTDDDCESSDQPHAHYFPCNVLCIGDTRENVEKAKVRFPNMKNASSTYSYSSDNTENAGNKSSDSDEEMRANIIQEFQQKKSSNVTNNFTKKDQLNIPPTQQDLQHQLVETQQPDLNDRDVNFHNNSGNNQDNIATLKRGRGESQRTDATYQQLQNGENISQLLGLNDENENIINNSLGKDQEDFPLHKRQKGKPQRSDQNDQQLLPNENGSDVSFIQDNFDDLLAREENMQRTIKPRLQGKTPIHKLDTLGKRHQIITVPNKKPKIYIGLDVLPELEVYEKARRIKKPTIFCRDMADIIWTPKKLVNRAIGLEYCKKKKINKFSPRKELEADKKELWEDEFNRYLTKKNVSTSLKEAIKADAYVTLGQKIQDLRKYYKELRRASGAPNTGWIFDEHYDP